MRFIRKIFGWAFLLVIGFIIGLFFGPQIIDELSPNEEAIQSEMLENNLEAEQVTQKRPRLADFLSPFPDSVDEEAVEKKIFELVNQLRLEMGLNPVEKNETLRQAAAIRAVETEESFSHTRPNGEDPFSVLQEVERDYFYEIIGENLAMATFLQDEEYMSALIMDGWINSEAHYQTMINPEYNEIGIGIHYNGEILYVTQFFGKQR